MNRERWADLMSRLSMGPNIDTYRSVHAACMEPHRYYHTTAHIDHCLAMLDQHIGLAANPNEVELALWFHDVVRKPLSKRNKIDSANLARQFLLYNGCKPPTCERVHELIMISESYDMSTDPDKQLFADIDLSILGSDSDTYQEFESNVRREYKWVPEPALREHRMALLRSFIDRDTIYSTEAFRDCFEEKARANLAASIQSLLATGALFQQGA